MYVKFAMNWGLFRPTKPTTTLQALPKAHTTDSQWHSLRRPYSFEMDVYKAIESIALLFF